MKSILLAFVLMAPVATLAAAPLSQSVEGPAESADSKARPLSEAPAVEGLVGRPAARGAARDCGCFEIFDVWVEQREDRDGDGYHQVIGVEFDADTTSARETVYARLYLRRDAGPWVLYSETGLFDIRYDEAADRYRVTTRLLEGFPPGRYELAIDLYALYRSGVVASRTVAFDQHGELLYLEDELNDEPPVEVIVIAPAPPGGEVVVIEDDPAYAGSMSPAWLLALGLVGFARRTRK